MIGFIVAALITAGLVWLFLKTTREECYRCRKTDWLLRMQAQEFWRADEEQPRIQYFHIKPCRHKPVGEFRRDHYGC